MASCLLLWHIFCSMSAVMRYHVLAADYDGTLAKDGAVDESTFEMLRKVRDSGRKIILVTGRRLEPLLELLPDVGLFDRIVAENGALVFDPETRKETQLADSPPIEFIDELRRRGVDPMEIGRCIVAMWRPHEHVALQVISDMALELQIIFNKDAVMILPSGINKAFGLRLAAFNAASSIPKETTTESMTRSPWAMPNEHPPSMRWSTPLPIPMAIARSASLGSKKKTVPHTLTNSIEDFRNFAVAPAARTGSSSTKPTMQRPKDGKR